MSGIGLDIRISLGGAYNVAVAMMTLSMTVITTMMMMITTLTFVDGGSGKPGGRAGVGRSPGSVGPCSTAQHNSVSTLLYLYFCLCTCLCAFVLHCVSYTIFGVCSLMCTLVCITCGVSDCPCFVMIYREDVPPHRSSIIIRLS